MRIKTDDNFKALSEWFSPLQKPLYLVGGAVRNALLELPSGDNDVCAAASVEEVERLNGRGFTVSPRPFGLGTLVIRADSDNADIGRACFEYTAFRKDSYGRGGAHRPQSVTFTHDIGEDAMRRDFTINALYADASGTVCDPLATGLSDLRNGVIRACSDKTLTEDALRILRMVRFSCELGFSVDEDTMRAAAENVSGLADISPERIYGEFEKILLSDARYGKKDAVLKGLFMLYELGAMEYVLPELLAGDGFLQSPKYHKYDVMRHSFYTCAAAPPELPLRLAALLHDVSKPVSYAADGHMHRHAQLGSCAAGEVLDRLRAPKALIEEVCSLIGAHMFDLDNRARRSRVARMVSKLGRERFLKLIELRKADFIGSGLDAPPLSAEKWQKILDEMERQGAPINLKALNFNGDDVKRVLGVKEGPVVGRVLKALHEYALKKPSQNDYQKLARYAKIVYEGLINNSAAQNADGAEDSSGV